jgi:subtilase family protein
LSPRKAALAFCALLVAAALPASTALEPATQAVLVFAPVQAGERVLDDYGAFHTAALTDAQTGGLRAQGIAVEPMDLAFHRGAWAIARNDARVPAPLRADVASGFWVVQFRGPVKAEWRDALASEVERVYDSVPSYAYLVKASPAQAQAVRATPEVAFVGAYHAAYKLAPELPSSGVADVAILTFPGEPLDGAVLAVAQAGGVVTSMTSTFARDGILKASVPASGLAQVARVPEVSWIEPAYDGITLDNAQASAITQSGQVGNWLLYGKGIDGSTQKLSICDTGVNTAGLTGVNTMAHEMDDDPTHPLVVWMLQVPDDANLHRKVYMYYAPFKVDSSTGAVTIGGDMDDADSHGTHTSGTLTGDAPPYGVRNGNDGVAYAAKLIVCDITSGTTFFLTDDYTLYWDPAYAAGARVNSNSWGNPHTNTYTIKARQHDAYVWDHRDFVIARSMGNTGGNTIRPEAVAKSALGVGATQNGAGLENLASFSSRGPTADGRMKPNVIAPGDSLVSAGVANAVAYVSLSGTSMSTPTVSGAAGLIRDYFAKGFYPSGAASEADSANPSAALVRGLLEVSGKRITGSLAGTGFPNANQGWGRVLLDDALYFAGDSRQLLAVDEGAGLATGETATFTLTVGAGQPLKVMLTWSDQPGAAGANPALVNDLDLEVTGPAGTYKGNVFTNGESQANSGTRDARNVDEAVLLATPTAGTYTVAVRGTNVPSGPQPFALVATHA